MSDALKAMSAEISAMKATIKERGRGMEEAFHEGYDLAWRTAGKVDAPNGYESWESSKAKHKYLCRSCGKRRTDPPADNRVDGDG